MVINIQFEFCLFDLMVSVFVPIFAVQWVPNCSLHTYIYTVWYSKMHTWAAYLI